MIAWYAASFIEPFHSLSTMPSDVSSSHENVRAPMQVPASVMTDPELKGNVSLVRAYLGRFFGLMFLCQFDG